VAFPANFELFWNERRERLERELEHVANLAERQQLPAEIREGALTSDHKYLRICDLCQELGITAALCIIAGGAGAAS
jgi:diphthamide synthase (EF-2-diphthine--ammonia ligase)